MPKDKEVDFIAIDEIQMCADRERGHIFTERMLRVSWNKINYVSWFSSNGKNY